MTEPSERPTEPLLRIVTPGASPEEIAAIVAVFAALGGSAEPTPARAPSAWSHPSRQVRETHRHGPGGWRASGLPH